jgi:hypothetical protein
MFINLQEIERKNREEKKKQRSIEGDLLLALLGE